MAAQQSITREMATRFINIYNTSKEVKEFIKECCENDVCIKKFCDNNYSEKHEKKSFLCLIHKAISILECEKNDKEYNTEYCLEQLSVNATTLTYLNAANENYHVLNQIKHRHYCQSKLNEDLSDMGFEENTCSICNFSSIDCTGTVPFFYSTSFGLNTPVCYHCVLSDDIDDPLMFVNKNNIEENKDDKDYVPSDEEDSASEADSSEADSSEADSSEALPSRMTIGQLIETIIGKADANEADASEAGANEAGLNEEETLEELYDISEDYNSGWNSGWKAAMKYISEQIKNSEVAPQPPKCDNCGVGSKLKNCSGTCNGCVKYCSQECQIIHWKSVHKYSCLKK
jgi:hypothetical protein